MRNHGESEVAYANALVLLANYVYKDDSGHHKERRCKEQFWAGLRSKEVNSYIANFCDKSGDLNELVNNADAYRATGYVKELVSDGEMTTPVTVAYVQL